MHEERFAGDDPPMPDDHSFGKGEPLDDPIANSGEAVLLQEAMQESARQRSRKHEFIDTATDRHAAPGHESDEALFKRYQAGDEAAFLMLYERYKTSIFAYCARVLMSEGISRDVAEDTFQDVFLRLAQYRQTFTGGEFKAWIFTVTRHSCLTAKKLAFRQRASTEYVGNSENFDDDASVEVRLAFSHNDDPLERMSRAEQATLLQQAIARLPEEFREALIMSEYDGLTYDEIGRITGTSLSTIRIRIYRAKSRLRKMLLPILGDQAADLLGESD
ncbi:MAG: RNA polymerase sigma factor [Bacteroidota bacterium]|nr:RNA polymerase sigma factor [Bacteroidota bacterium]